MRSRRALPALYAKLLDLDAALVAKGFPPLSPFWRETLRRFLAGDAQRLVARVGRRGGKSTTWAKLAVAFALHGAWSVPPGEVGLVAFLSVDRTEAAARLRSITAILGALGVAYDRRGDEIELRARPVVFRVVTASTTAVVGVTCVFALCDEVARWRDVETGANPAREIIASLSPTMATQPSARLVLSSSPWSTSDYHHEAFERGDDGHQQTAYAPSWIANPTLTEERTRRLEPDPRVWAREYLAMPSDAVSSICSAADYDAHVSAGVARRDVIPGAAYCFLNDPAGRLDYWAIVVAHRELRDVAPELPPVDTLVVDACVALKPTPLKRISVEDGVRANAELARTYPPASIYSDLHLFDPFSAAMRERGFRVRELPNSTLAISARVGELQARLAARGALDLVDDADLRGQVLGAQLLLHPGGRMTLKAPERRGAHDDLVSALLLALDSTTVAKLPRADGAVVVRHAPVRWDAGARTLSGGGASYFTRAPDGGLRPREPPYGSPGFVEWAREMVRQGMTTRSIERFFAAQEGRIEDGNTEQE